MEYLMTYGWAILIIAVVLGALYSLGVFNGTAFATQACVAVSGFYCQSPIFHAGVLQLTFGQATGTNWAGANLIFVPFGNTYTGSTVFGSNNIEAFNSGQTTSVSFTSNWLTGNSVLGTSVQGYLYANYIISGVSYSVQVATVTVKST